MAAPLTSIDMALTSGDRIKIEERPDREMTHIGEHRIAAPGNTLILTLCQQSSVKGPNMNGKFIFDGFESGTTIKN